MEKSYKILKLLIWVLLFAVVIVGASVLYNRLSSEVELGGIATTPQVVEDPTGETEAQGSEAPDFTVYDLEGNVHKLSDFRGKPVLLNFWASWCGPCKSEMPDFQKAWEQYGETVHFMTVNMTDGMQETLEKAKAYVTKEGYTFPVYFDTDLDAAMTYGVSAIPATYFVAADGSLIARASGAISLSTLEKGLSMILE